MRKVFLFMMTTLDGYVEGKNHDLSWHNVDTEFNIFADAQLDETDTLIFGRRTYDMMAAFWPTSQGIEAAPDTATRMNSLRKVAFTHRPFTPTWESTDVYTDILKLDEIKQRPGKSIAVLGSSNLCVALLEAGLLDELRIMVNPVVLGSGTLFLDGLGTPPDLDLTDTRTFQNGNVLLRYAVKK